MVNLHDFTWWICLCIVNASVKSYETTLCLKKVPTFELSVILWNPNRFSKHLHWNLLQNLCDIIHLTLGMMLHYLGKLNIQFSADVQQICKKMRNKLHFKCTDFNSSTLVTVYAKCIYVFLSKCCPHRWMQCSLLMNTAVTSALTNFRCHKLIAKVNK